MQTRMKWTLVIAVAVFSAACGDSMSSLNPTAPSALSRDTNVAANAADLEAGSMGNGPKPPNGNGNGNGNGNRPPAPSSTETPSLGKVELEGLVNAVGNGSITVNNQKLVVTANTVIRKGSQALALSDLRAGDRVHVRANRIAPTASGLTLEAVEIRFQETGDAVEPPAPASFVSVTAVDADASENGSAPGVFRLARSGDASASLTVSVSFVGGSATNGVDYETLSPTVTFPGGHATVDVTVTPKTDSLVEGDEAATLTVIAGAGYELGSPVSATVNIADHVVPTGPVVTVVASDPQAHENPDLFDFGIFDLTRTGNLAVPLTVTVAFSGNAQNGTDYQTLETTVTFDPFVSTASVALFANPDGDNDPSETVVLTLMPGTGYTVGTPAVATVTIQQ